MKFKGIIELVCAMLLIVVLCSFVMSSMFPQYELEETSYVVKRGDCLWDIAEEYCPDSMDKWDYINRVMERNDLSDSVIHPGQRLIVFQSQS